MFHLDPNMINTMTDIAQIAIASVELNKRVTPDNKYRELNLDANIDFEHKVFSLSLNYKSYPMKG